MSQDEILNYNKMCAEFLNWKSLSPKTKYCYWKFPQDLCFTLRAGEPVHSNNLLFQSDWNWIMLVIETIEKLGYWVCIQYTYIGFGKKDCENTFLNYSFSSLRTTKKDAVVYGINQFLIWYNNNK